MPIEMTSNPQPLNHWAIKVSPDIVEFRVIRGPAKVKISILKKKVKVPGIDPDGCNCYACMASAKPTMRNIEYKQTTFLNGRVIGYYLLSLCKSSELKLAMGNQDAVKLNKEQVKLIRNATWRENNL